MSNTRYMPLSTSDIHITPEGVFDLIKEYWGHDRYDMFDVCPVNHNFDGLAIRWTKLNYCNPPYTNLRDWVRKAEQQTEHNRETIMLLPTNKTDQAWFHDIILKNNFEIRYIRGRLKFKNNKHNAPQPHFLVRVVKQ